VLTLAGINLVIMVNVAVVVETVFAWPGIGRLLYEGISSATSRWCRPPSSSPAP
jgi:peptide/nickel transport system permease protein